MKATEGEKTELTNKATQRHDAMEESATNFHNPEEVATTSTEEGRKVSWPDPEINKRYEEWKKVMNGSNENMGGTNYELAGKTQEMMPRRQALDHGRGEMNTSTETVEAETQEMISKTLTPTNTQQESSVPRRQALDHRRGEMNTSTETTKAASTNLPSTIQKTQTERNTISRQTKRSLPTEVSTNAKTQTNYQLPIMRIRHHPDIYSG